MDKDYDFFDWDIHDDKEGKCVYCNGRGYMYVEQGSSLTYPCTDCEELEEERKHDS